MLHKLRALLTQTETWLAAGSLFLLLALSLLQIFARNFFQTGFPDVDSFARHMVLYVTFFGAVLAIERQSHIKIDVITAWLSKDTLDKLYRPLQLVGAVVCALLADAATRFWIDEWQYAVAADRWITLLNLVLPVGFALLSIHFLFGVLLGPAKSEKPL